jgi:hypothetical protein
VLFVIKSDDSSRLMLKKRFHELIANLIIIFGFMADFSKIIFNFADKMYSVIHVEAFF